MVRCLPGVGEFLPGGVAGEYLAAAPDGEGPVVMAPDKAPVRFDGQPDAEPDTAVPVLEDAGLPPSVAELDRRQILRPRQFLVTDRGREGDDDAAQEQGRAGWGLTEGGLDLASGDPAVGVLFRQGRDAGPLDHGGADPVALQVARRAGAWREGGLPTPASSAGATKD